MNIKELYKRFVFLITVPKCVCCGERLDFEDTALCKECKREYERIKFKDCSVCSMPLSRCSCTNGYLERRFVHKIAKVYRYIPTDMTEDKLPSNELIYKLKREARYDLLDFLSGELASSVRKLITKDKSEYIITSVPRQRERIKKYGMDHSELLGRRTAKILGIKYEKLLLSEAKLAQKKTVGEERYKNAKFAYRKETDLSARRVIIIDDLITTGASVGAAALMIKGLGAKEIMAASIAIAYKDTYRPFLPTQK
jgi:ComF family protein